MKSEEYEGSERRVYFRILYRSTKRPKLVTGKHEFEIADISEGGIRLINNHNIKLEESVRGTTIFLYGESMDIEGTIVWERNNEIGLLLNDYIPPATMQKENQFVILSSLKNDI